jgi:hypothetical protein
MDIQIWSLMTDEHNYCYLIECCYKNVTTAMMTMPITLLREAKLALLVFFFAITKIVPRSGRNKNDIRQNKRETNSGMLLCCLDF